jgi:hypothetical protein
MLKLLILFLTTSSLLFSGDDFMAYWKAYHFAILLSLAFLIVLIPIWMIVTLVSKGKSDRFFKRLVLVDLTILIISIISLYVDHYIDEQNYKPSHTFQKPYEYGVYMNNIVVFEEQNNSIIDIYLNDYFYWGGHRNLSYLTKKELFAYNTFTAYDTTTFIYIDTSIVHPIMGKYSNNSFILLSKNKDILYFDLNSTKFQNKQSQYTLA